MKEEYKIIVSRDKFILDCVERKTPIYSVWKFKNFGIKDIDVLFNMDLFDDANKYKENWLIVKCFNVDVKAFKSLSMDLMQGKKLLVLVENNSNSIKNSENLINFNLKYYSKTINDFYYSEISKYLNATFANKNKPSTQTIRSICSMSSVYKEIEEAINDIMQTSVDRGDKGFWPYKLNVASNTKELFSNMNTSDVRNPKNSLMQGIKFFDRHFNERNVNIYEEILRRAVDEEICDSKFTGTMLRLSNK